MIIRHKFSSYTLPHESEHVITKLNQIKGIKATIEGGERGVGGTLVLESDKDLSNEDIFSFGALTQTLLHNAIIR